MLPPPDIYVNACAQLSYRPHRRRLGGSRIVLAGPIPVPIPLIIGSADELSRRPVSQAQPLIVTGIACLNYMCADGSFPFVYVVNLFRCSE